MTPSVADVTDDDERVLDRREHGRPPERVGPVPRREHLPAQESADLHERVQRAAPRTGSAPKTTKNADDERERHPAPRAQIDRPRLVAAARDGRVGAALQELPLHHDEAQREEQEQHRQHHGGAEARHVAAVREVVDPGREHEDPGRRAEELRHLERLHGHDEREDARGQQRGQQQRQVDPPERAPRAGAGHARRLFQRGVHGEERGVHEQEQHRRRAHGAQHDEPGVRVHVDRRSPGRGPRRRATGSAGRRWARRGASTPAPTAAPAGRT